MGGWGWGVRKSPWPGGELWALTAVSHLEVQTKRSQVNDQPTINTAKTTWVLVPEHGHGGRGHDQNLSMGLTDVDSAQGGPPPAPQLLFIHHSKPGRQSEMALTPPPGDGHAWRKPTLTWGETRGYSESEWPVCGIKYDEVLWDVEVALARPGRTDWIAHYKGVLTQQEKGLKHTHTPEIE